MDTHLKDKIYNKSRFYASKIKKKTIILNNMQKCVLKYLLLNIIFYKIGQKVPHFKILQIENRENLIKVKNEQ